MRKRDCFDSEPTKFNTAAFLPLQKEPDHRKEKATAIDPVDFSRSSPQISHFCTDAPTKRKRKYKTIIGSASTPGFRYKKELDTTGVGFLASGLSVHGCLLVSVFVPALSGAARLRTVPLHVRPVAILRDAVSVPSSCRSDVGTGGGYRQFRPPQWHR